MTEREPDEFDRIVAGIEFDHTDEQEFMALENTPIEDSEPTPDALEPTDETDQEPKEVLDDDELPDFIEVTYRQPSSITSVDGRLRQAGWLTLASVPFVYILLALAKVYISPAVSGIIVLASVALLAYLLLTNPNRSQHDDTGSDGSSI